MFEHTLLNIKPDGVKRNIIGEIIRRVEQRGFRIVAIDRHHLTRKEAEAFYEVHEGKPFFKKLVDFMSSGPCMPMVVEGEDAIKGVRQLIGATDPSVAAEGTIRREFGTDVTHNCVHASDAQATAKIEIDFFFSQVRLIDGGRIPDEM